MKIVFIVFLSILLMILILLIIGTSLQAGGYRWKWRFSIWWWLGFKKCSDDWDVRNGVFSWRDLDAKYPYASQIFLCIILFISGLTLGSVGYIQKLILGHLPYSLSCLITISAFIPWALHNAISPSIKGPQKLDLVKAYRMAQGSSIFEIITEPTSYPDPDWRGPTDEEIKKLRKRALATLSKSLFFTGVGIQSLIVSILTLIREG